VYKQEGEETAVFLVHPGGPFWKNKDRNAWSIPKGEFDPDKENSLDAGLREFKEETGLEPPGRASFLGRLKPSGKSIDVWIMSGNPDPEKITSNTFRMEWPKNSGTEAEFPEIDRAAWFDLETAAAKLHKGQTPLVDMLKRKLEA
jgi:predicted NUDIX family NTP pyrophosphohydrolase